MVFLQGCSPWKVISPAKFYVQATRDAHSQQAFPAINVCGSRSRAWPAAKCSAASTWAISARVWICS